jgi:putative SOS response-associated peptidase YedK
MCGRFSLKTTPDTLERIFGHPAPPGYQPRYNVAPSQEVLAIVAEEGAERAAMLRWGLIPFWAKDPGIGNKLVNARAESLGEKPAFRNAFRKRRCLILADGFYEWQQRHDGKHPMWVHLPNGEPFALAGLWERWDRGEHPVETCTIVTTDANPFMRTIHTRMPIILGAAAGKAWLDAQASEEALHDLLTASAEVELEAHEVSRMVNNPANDRPECIEAMESEESLVPLTVPAPEPVP